MYLEHFFEFFQLQAAFPIACHDSFQSMTNGHTYQVLSRVTWLFGQNFSCNLFAYRNR